MTAKITDAGIASILFHFAQASRRVSAMSSGEHKVNIQDSENRHLGTIFMGNGVSWPQAEPRWGVSHDRGLPYLKCTRSSKVPFLLPAHPCGKPKC
jgi:hypothetical protein